MHIPFDGDSSASSTATATFGASMERFVRFAIGSALLLLSEASIFRFVSISVLVTVCDDVYLIHVADGPATFSLVLAGFAVVVLPVATLLLHMIDDLTFCFDADHAVNSEFNPE